MRKIDAADARLLEAVQQDAHLTAEQLGAACGLSPTAALKRLKRLRADGIIEREAALVSPRALGYAIMAVVMVTLDRLCFVTLRAENATRRILRMLLVGR